MGRQDRAEPSDLCQAWGRVGDRGKHRDPPLHGLVFPCGRNCPSPREPPSLPPLREKPSLWGIGVSSLNQESPRTCFQIPAALWGSHPPLCPIQPLPPLSLLRSDGARRWGTKREAWTPGPAPELSEFRRGEHCSMREGQRRAGRGLGQSEERAPHTYGGAARALCVLAEWDPWAARYVFQPFPVLIMRKG